MHNIIRAALLTACALVALNGSPAIAADRPIELGTSLTTAAIGVGDNSGGVVGVPTSSFGLVGPGVFATFFPSARIGIEPQLGLIYVRQRGESVHFVSLAGQVDYFFRGIEQRSPYVFGGAGLTDVSASETTPKSVTVGIGYRIPIGNLSLRVDGRLAHVTSRGDDSNSLVFGLSIGGLFGGR